MDEQPPGAFPQPGFQNLPRRRVSGCGRQQNPQLQRLQRNRRSPVPVRGARHQHLRRGAAGQGARFSGAQRRSYRLCTNAQRQSGTRRDGFADAPAGFFRPVWLRRRRFLSRHHGHRLYARFRRKLEPDILDKNRFGRRRRGHPAIRRELPAQYSPARQQQRAGRHRH